MKNIVIVAHKYLTQPDDELVVFLNNQKYNNVLHICHSFSDAKDRCSYYKLYKQGELFKEIKTKDYQNLNEVFIYLKELYFTLKWILKSKEVWDFYIGMDGLCVLFGNILRKFNKIKNTIFWAIDFVPKDRFKSKLKNLIYHKINISGYKNSDQLWDLSPRMHEAREKFLNIKKSDYKKYKIVPYGIWPDRIKKYDYNQCEKNTLVFMGHLIEKQGVQLVLKAVPEIVKKIPDFKFKVIGDGKYKIELIKLANQLNILKYCDFKGRIVDIKQLENEVAKSAVAIAPYIKEFDTWTYYADPGKVKTYLGCGVPVLLTDIPWNANEIVENKCGLIITGKIDDLVEKIVWLIKKDNNPLFRKNTEKYSQSFSYEHIFKEIL